MAPFGLYLHIPFCVRKCPYCDFNSYAKEPGSIPELEYVEALIGEIAFYSKQPAWSGRPIQTVFFGGGTPSIFSAESIGRVLAAITTQFTLSTDAEVTLEANPGTIQEQLGREKLRALREGGINRISMGVQSFADKKLRALGRIHSSADLTAAVENICHAGFTNFNLDLMFGIAGETLAEWRGDLGRAISFAPTHISAYGLTIEAGTEFGRLFKKGLLPVSTDVRQAKMYLATQQDLEHSGYGQYEISNYAKPGFECRHNLGYWRGCDYLGIGAGAHSYLDLFQGGDTKHYGSRWSNIPGPNHYIRRIKESGDASQLRELIAKESAEFEFFFLGLRSTAGVSSDSFERRFGSSLTARYRTAFLELKKRKLVQEMSGSLRLTSRGFRYADTILANLFPDES